MAVTALRRKAQGCTESGLSADFTLSSFSRFGRYAGIVSLRLWPPLTMFHSCTHAFRHMISGLLTCAVVLACPAMAHAGDAQGADAHETVASAASGAESSIRPKLKPDLKSQLRGESSSAGKGEERTDGRDGKSVRGEVKSEATSPTKSANKPEAKAEGKAVGKDDASGDTKTEGKSALSMADLRDVLDQKIAEVRATRTAAPVVKIRARGDKRERLALAQNTSAERPPEHVEAAHPAAASLHAAWSYSGATGPEHWAQLKSEYAQCGMGQRQSPIDISDGIPVELDPIAFDYRPSAFRVIDNGHTVQVNLAPGNRITVNGRRYELLQFHFHRPSEERLNGKQFDMVVHMVHKDVDGKLAVVAVLISEGKGHPLVQQVWNNLPLEQFIEQPGLGAIDLTQLLPEQRQYLTYMGSLTTPPCTEGVLWMVMKQPVTASPEQLAIFGRLYPMNARPVQRTAGRLIKDGQ
jgi:carbonic anhydrase